MKLCLAILFKSEFYFILSFLGFSQRGVQVFIKPKGRFVPFILVINEMKQKREYFFLQGVFLVGNNISMQTIVLDFGNLDKLDIAVIVLSIVFMIEDFCMA